MLFSVVRVQKTIGAPLNNKRSSAIKLSSYIFVFVAIHMTKLD